MYIRISPPVGTFSLYKLGTEGYECAEPHSCLNIGLPALRRETTTTAASVSRKAVLEHPLVREAVAYWQGALDVVNTATTSTSSGGVRIYTICASIGVLMQCFDAVFCLLCAMGLVLRCVVMVSGSFASLNCVAI